jgi:hypothetical protein
MEPLYHMLHHLSSETLEAAEVGTTPSPPPSRALYRREWRRQNRERVNAQRRTWRYARGENTPDFDPFEGPDNCVRCGMLSAEAFCRLCLIEGSPRALVRATARQRRGTTTTRAASAGSLSLAGRGEQLRQAAGGGLRAGDVMPLPGWYASTWERRLGSARNAQGSRRSASP